MYIDWDYWCFRKPPLVTEELKVYKARDEWEVNEQGWEEQNLSGKNLNN